MQPPQRVGTAADQLPDIAPVLHRARLWERHTDDDDVVTDGQVDIGPMKRGHLAAAQGPVEDQRDDRRVDQAAAHGRLIAFHALAGASRPATEGQDAIALFGGQAPRRAATTRGSRGGGGSTETLKRLPGQRAIRLQSAGMAGGAPHSGDHDGGGRLRAAGRAQAVQIRGQVRVVERPAVEPGREPAERAAVGGAGVRGRGQLRAADRNPGAGGVRADPFIGSGRGARFRIHKNHYDASHGPMC